MRHSLSRREMLSRCSSGFGLLALQGMLGTPAVLSAKTNFKAKAKSVIFCYMSGGASHLDTFDPKPELKKYAGKPMPVKIERTQFNKNGNVFPSPFEFKPYGKSGIPVSSIFPKVCEMADDLAVVRSMTSKVNDHAQGNYAFHSGFPFMGHPSAGAWVSYGLGSANENLPSFVVLNSAGSVAPHGGVGLYGSGYLPAGNQGSILQVDNSEPVRNVKPRESLFAQRNRLSFLKGFDKSFLSQTGENLQVEAAIKNYETAYKMQAAVPELCDLSGETETTKKLYGLDNGQCTHFARQCLMARRMIERGVRYVQIYSGGMENQRSWDGHNDIMGNHTGFAGETDQPIAGLLHDLEERGLLDETLVIWGGEFGRLPVAQKSNKPGRDHNPHAGCYWFAGGGVKSGTSYGETDELGHQAVVDKVEIHDLHATILHLLGLDHKKLTFKHNGRRFRLTDVAGRVINQIVA